ncbi:hypothetical protein FRC11_002418 [Ceratobasidium sp. 423]|nr:hypothetical protein FRC11_002418 [Ceratobasidium sp. 423]
MSAGPGYPPGSDNLSDWDPDVDVTGISIEDTAQVNFVPNAEKQSDTGDASVTDLASDGPTFISGTEDTYVDVTGISDKSDLSHYASEKSPSMVLPEYLSEPEAFKPVAKTVRFESTPRATKAPAPPAPAPFSITKPVKSTTQGQLKAVAHRQTAEQRQGDCQFNYIPEAPRSSKQGGTVLSRPTTRPNFASMMGAFAGARKK